MPPKFNNLPQSLGAPAQGAIAITPSDATALSNPVRAITIGTAGVLSYEWPLGTIHTTATLPAGTYVMWAARVRATGTTATGLTGWI